MEQEPAGKKKKSRLKRYPCAAFAAVAVLTGGAYATGHLTSPPAGEPRTVQVFDAKASWTPLTSDVFNYNDMLSRQQHYMDNPKDAGEYKAFLATFDKFRGQPLEEMAQNVNAAVQKEITYSDTQHPLDFIYWETPFQVIASHKADCKGYAALHYSIMRYLGVPEDRLFMALVSSGQHSILPDHFVLLLNTAPMGQTPNFVVLNDVGAVVNANDYEQVNGSTPEWQIWQNSYKLYAVLSPDGLWVNPDPFMSTTSSPAKTEDLSIINQMYAQAVKAEKKNGHVKGIPYLEEFNRAALTGIFGDAAYPFHVKCRQPEPGQDNRPPRLACTAALVIPPSVRDEMISQVRKEITNDANWTFLNANSLSLDKFDRATLTGTFNAQYNGDSSDTYTITAKCKQAQPARNGNPPPQIKCAIFSVSPPIYPPVSVQMISEISNQLQTAYPDAAQPPSLVAFNKAALTGTVSAYSISDNEKYYFKVRCQKVQSGRNDKSLRVKCAIDTVTSAWVNYNPYLS
jgi:predicted transglutaminase-like cysteine proteinase